MKTLYISYDGMLEPLGQSQVLGYLRHIGRTHAVTVLSFEKSRDLRDRERVQQAAERMRHDGIRWVRLRYHKRPSLIATAYDVVCGMMVGFVLCKSRGIGMVHARGYVSSVIAWCLKRACGVKFIFDMRGFWPDEKVDAGHWTSASRVYRMAKRWERRFFEQADAIVSLTEAGIREFPGLGYAIPPETPIVMIPTCADLDAFMPGAKSPQLLGRLGLRGRLVLGCVGNLSSWYLRGPMLECLAVLSARLDQAKVLFVTDEDHVRLRADAVAAGIHPDRMVFVRADFPEMPAYLRLMDLGVFFIKVCFSKRGSAATKLGEFLGSGVPVVINDGIGDSGRIVSEHRVGVVLDSVSRASSAAAVAPIRDLLAEGSLRARCREAARAYFDLQEGVRKYLGIYDRLGGVAQEHPGVTSEVLEPGVTGVYQGVFEAQAAGQREGSS